MKRIVLIFSGGQDSTTCLIQALNIYNEIHCITFNYKQKHLIEIKIAKNLTKLLNIKTHKIINIKTLADITNSSLINKNINIPIYNKIQLSAKTTTNQLPNTFVPGRNIMFLTLATIYAYQMQIKKVMIGTCKTDVEGYPDSSNTFIKYLNKAINIGMNYNVQFITPLIKLNKAEIWALADYYNKLDLIRKNTLSCYNGIKGDGCKQCRSCHLRLSGLKQYLKEQKNIEISLKAKIKLKQKQ